MKISHPLFLALSLAAFAIAIPATHAQTPAPVKEKPEASVRHERILGVVVTAPDADRTMKVRLPNGTVERVRIAKNAYLHTLRGHDERQRRLDPAGPEFFQPGMMVSATGLVYSDTEELLAKEVTFLGDPARTPLIEDADWWSSQAKELADFWVRTQFGTGEIGDASGYRTDITKTGTKRPETINLQESATIARLIYGLSSTYIINGNPRVLQAAAALVKYQRERLKVESPDGKYVYWYHALRDGKPILPSLFNEDAGTIPLYEQIYCLAGLTQYYRVTGDPVVLSDIEKTVRFMDDFFWDWSAKEPLMQGYFSHIHPGTFSPADTTELNRLKKNWNSVGDHLPAYLENLYLGTRDPKYLKRLTELGTLISEHFPDSASPFVFERFDSQWKPDLTYSWQQNRGVVGHNLKIAWCLTRLYHLTGNPRFLEVAKKCGDEMIIHGQDGRRGGWYDVVERVADPKTGRHELAWHDRKIGRAHV